VKVGDLVRRLSVPLRIGMVVGVDDTGVILFYHDDNKAQWVSFDLLEVISESR